MVDKFKGFSPDREQLTRIPDSFFTQLLVGIDDLNELKVTLYAFWHLEKTEGAFPYITRRDIHDDEALMEALGGGHQAHVNLASALSRAVARGSLLTAQADEHQLYFLNTPLGRSAIEAIENGHWEYGGQADFPIKLNIQKPSIFSIYENNIGMITQTMADKLKEAEKNYPFEWIEQAIDIAVVNNVRKWAYVEAILRNWQEEGRNDRTDQRRGRQAQEKYDPERYTKGKFSDFIKS
jgi:DnaD/phage-associated family protein